MQTLFSSQAVLELLPPSRSPSRKDASSNIEWRCGDSTKELASCRGELLFVDPRWGEDYDRTHMRLADMPFLGAVLEAGKHFPRIWLKVPPSFDVACPRLGPKPSLASAKAIGNE